MNSLSNVRAITKTKSWRKLTGLSIFIFLVVMVILFYAVYKDCENKELELMVDNIKSIPELYQHNMENLFAKKAYVEEDNETRAELGSKIYAEEKELTDAEKLEKARSEVSAASVSVLDEQKQILLTTGPVSPEDFLSSTIQTIEANTPYSYYYIDDSEEMIYMSFVLVPVPENTRQSLLFEFYCDELTTIWDDTNTWHTMWNQMLYREDSSVFNKFDDEIEVYPEDGYTSAQYSQILEEANQIIENRDSLQTNDEGISSGIVTLLGKPYLATIIHHVATDDELTSSEEDYMVTVPLINVVKNDVFIAIAIAAIIGWGIILIRFYIFRCLQNEDIPDNFDNNTRKRISQKTWPGILIVLLITAFFSYLLLALENRTTATVTATSRQKSLQYEIDWCHGQEQETLSYFEGLYLKRSQVLTNFLMKHPEYDTAEGMEELNRIAKSDYVMRFDKAGRELFASNSYTGFSVASDLSKEYRGVLKGYSHVVTGPEADPYTGQEQVSTAVLMKNDAGQPDGFLLVVYNAEALMGELDELSLENTVNSFVVRKDYAAAAIGDEEGRFIAHSDPAMIGLKAQDYLPEVTPGSSFEGLTSYNGKKVCVSASPLDGNTIVFMVDEPETNSPYMTYAFLAIMLIMLLLFYPAANQLTAKAISEAKETLEPAEKMKYRLRVFVDGYNIFLMLFTVFVFLATTSGWSTSFSFIFSQQWSKGINLFSLWAVLIILACVLFGKLLIDKALGLVESRLGIRDRTSIGVVRSFIFYAVAIFLIFAILDLFGANTTTLLASAGVVSIALGMGAQSLAEDIIAGLFVILDDTLHVSDRVSIDPNKTGDVFTGTVTHMGIRVTEITDEAGGVLILNNSELRDILNMDRNPKEQGPEKEQGQVQEQVQEQANDSEAGA